MAAKPANPPAFPRPYFENGKGEWSAAQEGMSLRDHFAGQALKGILPFYLEKNGFHGGTAYANAAAHAVRFADALLEVLNDEARHG